MVYFAYLYTREALALQQSYALFDFDGTLIPGDSIVRFLFYCKKRGFCGVGSLLRGAVMGLGYGLRLVGAEKSKQQSLLFLRGRTREEVDKLSADFARDVLLPAMYPDGLARLRAHAEAGAKILLVSASPQFYLEPLCALLHIDGAVATRWHVDEGVYTGELAGENCRGVQKPLRLAEYLAAHGEMVDYAASAAYGDTAGDAPMLNLCAAKYVVNPRKKLLRALEGAQGVEVLRFKR